MRDLLDQKLLIPTIRMLGEIIVVACKPRGSKATDNYTTFYAYQPNDVIFYANYLWKNEIEFTQKKNQQYGLSGWKIAPPKTANVTY